MDKTTSSLAHGSALAVSGRPRRPFCTRKTVLWALGAALVVLVVAWVDGGEEPIHAIVQPVVVPPLEGGQ